VFALTGVALSVGYLRWLRGDAGDLLTTPWTLELIAAPLWAVFLIVGMTRLSGRAAQGLTESLQIWQFADRSIGRFRVWGGVEGFDIESRGFIRLA
jgi:hypothetical protein